MPARRPRPRRDRGRPRAQRAAPAGRRRGRRGAQVPAELPGDAARGAHAAVHASVVPGCARRPQPDRRRPAACVRELRARTAGVFRPRAVRQPCPRERRRRRGSPDAPRAPGPACVAASPRTTAPIHSAAGSRLRCPRRPPREDAASIALVLEAGGALRRASGRPSSRALEAPRRGAISSSATAGLAGVQQRVAQLGVLGPQVAVLEQRPRTFAGSSRALPSAFVPRTGRAARQQQLQAGRVLRLDARGRRTRRRRGRRRGRAAAGALAGRGRPPAAP